MVMLAYYGFDVPTNTPESMNNIDKINMFSCENASNEIMEIQNRTFHD